MWWSRNLKKSKIEEVKRLKKSKIEEVKDWKKWKIEVLRLNPSLRLK
jgi:hypothetical protein